MDEYFLRILHESQNLFCKYLLRQNFLTLLEIQPLIMKIVSPEYRSTLCRSWFRHCTASQKIVSSISDGVIGIFHCLNPSGLTISLGSNLLRTEMSIRNLSQG
jgi:hypothetical protein